MFYIPHYQRLLDHKASIKQGIPPLISWDVFRESLNVRYAQLEALHEFNRMAQHHGWCLPLPVDDMVLNKGRVLLLTDRGGIIQFATPNVYNLTGFEAQELVGQTPAILQGPKTEPESLSQIRSAITTKAPFAVCLTNYKKTGGTYQCTIEGYPLMNRAKQLTHYIAFEYQS